MAVRRTPYPFSNFRGENNVDSLVEQKVFGAHGGGQHKLRRLRGYQTIGWGREKKRYGYKPYVSEPINGTATGQGVAVHRKGQTYHLVAVAGDKIKVMDKAGDTWDDITGSVVPQSGQDVLWRFGRFNDGTDQWLIGSDGVTEPWLWDGNAANPARLLSTFDATVNEFNNIVGVDEFRGHVLVMTHGGLIYSQYGAINFSNAGAGVIETGRGSRGLALHRHSANVALLFYEEEIYALESNPETSITWRALPIEDSEPCISKTSIVTKDGVTYYAGSRGMYALKADGRPAKYIGREIEDFWMELNRSRDTYISRITRGQPWNELMWLVSYSTSTTHDAIIVYNDQLQSWNIFPRSATDGIMEFNCGVSWPDANGVPRTIVIDYNGIAHEAFGHRFADSGYTDDGTPVATLFETGFLDYGWSGVSATRNVILDLEVASEKEMVITAEIMGKAPYVKNVTLGAGGDLLDVGFILDESILAEALVSQSQVKLDQDGRYLKLTITEDDTGIPHVISSLNFPHLNKGMRMTA